MSIQELARSAVQCEVFRRDDDYETLEIIADPSPAASFSDGWFAQADDLVDDAAPRAPHPLRVPLVLIAVALVACVGVLSI